MAGWVMFLSDRLFIICCVNSRAHEAEMEAKLPLPLLRGSLRWGRGGVLIKNLLPFSFLTLSLESRWKV